MHVLCQGGGYAYRLAPAHAPLTEETFRKMPLDFVGPSILRWGGDRATQLEFDPLERGWQTSQGTMPRNSSWRKLPLPNNYWEEEGPSFEVRLFTRKLQSVNIDALHMLHFVGPSNEWE